MVRNLYYDVVIAGCGVAGLYTALSLPEDQKILMLSKEGIENCDSMPGSYKHLTLPTSDLVVVSGAAGTLQQKQS